MSREEHECPVAGTPQRGGGVGDPVDARRMKFITQNLQGTDDRWDQGVRVLVLLWHLPLQFALLEFSSSIRNHPDAHVGSIHPWAGGAGTGLLGKGLGAAPWRQLNQRRRMHTLAKPMISHQRTPLSSGEGDVVPESTLRTAGAVPVLVRTGASAFQPGSLLSLI